MHHDPKSYVPDADNCICITLTLSIGPDAEDGSEYFDVFVCSPEWIAKNKWVPELVRHMLIIRKYDLDMIVETVNKCIEKCTDKDWPSSAIKLSRYFAWEFEDYQP